MQRNYLRGLLICLIPCLLATLFAARPEKYRLGIDLAGGTILVYEINTDRLKLRKEQAKKDAGELPVQSGQPEEVGLSGDEMNQLAAQIKKRIDPTDIKNVTVRPLGRTRFEIILPFSGASGAGKENATAEYIEDVKRLISQMGVLEFRILANGTDDAPGITAARALVDGKTADELNALAAAGLPPESPTDSFDVRINDVSAKVTYKWTELAAEERASLGLSNAAAEFPGGLWSVAQGYRDGRTEGRRTFPVRTVNQGDRTVYVEAPDVQGCMFVLYSRAVPATAPAAQLEIAAARRAVLDTKLPPERRLPESVIKGADGKEKTDQEIYQAILTDPAVGKVIEPKRYEYFILTRLSPEDSLRIGGDVTLTATAGTDPKTFNPCVEFTLNGAGGQAFGKITRRNKKSGNVTRHLAVLLDDRVVSAPGLQSEITTRGQITGSFDRKTVERQVQILRSGALSAELREKPVSENTIGATLGADTVRRGVWAVGMAFVAVLAFMVVYYRFAGLVACIALFANLLLTIGFMVAVNAAFTLPGLAGLVLCLGMAVDANVLIYERLREERDKGANLATAIRNGYDRAFLTIIDTHLTSIFTAIVLYTFGNDQLKGFAISLTVGLVISLFTSLYMTRLMFDYWQHRKWLTQLRMMRLFSRPNVHPMKYRWFFLPFTAALTVVGLAVFLYRGESGLNVDFRGGTVFAGRLVDGEERALTKTPDGKAGFRELLGEENQKKRLTPVAAERLPDETAGSGTAAKVYVYAIEYADSTRTRVVLSQPPAGATEDEMRADVLARAKHLPDVSVEQLFLTGESYPDGKSRRFTIRTTERQPDLVRASLDRLLQDDGKSLIFGATMSYKDTGAKVKDDDGREWPVPATDKATVELEFSQPTSPIYARQLFDLEFSQVNRRKPDVDTYSLTGVGESVEGKYTRMQLSVAKNPAFDQLAAAAPNAAAREKQLATLARVLGGVRQAFNAAPEPERLEVFDSQLAAETRTKAFYAILASWVAILLYLWFRFGNWTFGLAAVLCLVHDLCFTLGMIAACHYLHVIPGMVYLGIEDFKIDLAAVAALLTLVGYSVNEIIVNFARIREVRGKNPKLTPDMINDSVSQTLSRTILTSMTVLLVSLVLYIFGGEGVHLFAFVMVVGVLVSTYSSIFVASPLLLIFGEGHDEDGTAAAQPDEPADKEDSPEEVVEG